MRAFPFSNATPVTWPGPHGKKADVVVIGGGIIGICTALFLARGGAQVIVLEKGRIAAEQSSRNWGWIRQQGRDADELPIMVEARRHWRDLAQQTSVDIGLTKGGVTYLARTEAEIAAYEDWLPDGINAGTGSRILNAAETAGMFPDMVGGHKGALHTASDMQAEPWVAVPAIAGIAAREGVQIVENCAVRRLDIAAGRVAGVITETGRITAADVVLAGGAWSSLFLRAHGIALPQLSVRTSVAATRPLPDIHAGCAGDANVSFRRRRDGGYTVAGGDLHELFVGPDAFRYFRKYLNQLCADPFGTRLLPAAPRDFPDGWRTSRQWTADQQSPFERQRVLNPAPNMAHLGKLRGRFQGLFPGLPEVRFDSAWAGMIDTMPDIVPVVDKVTDLPGLTIGTGMSGHGFGIGPGMGRVLASLVTGGTPGHDLSRFRMSRFSDGSPMRLGPSL
ncbi:MAG: FAD-binding oxidoreductase [Sulfitobacter sp.]